MLGIQYRYGDIGELFKKPEKEFKNTILLPHVVNDRGKWGAGFTKTLDKYCPNVGLEYKKWHQYSHELKPFVGLEGEWPTNDFTLGATQYCEVHPKLIVVNMLAQNGVGISQRRIKYDALVNCMEDIMYRAKAIKLYSLPCHIETVKFGSGLAGGDWDFISCLIEDIWLSHAIEVTVYE